MDPLFPPGPQKHLLLGNARAFRNDPLQAMVSAAREYGEIVHFRFGPSHAYLVTSAEHSHYVLTERPDLFDSRKHFYRAIQSAFGHELFAPKDGVYKRDNAPSALPNHWLNAYAPGIVDATLNAVRNHHYGEKTDIYALLQTLRLPIAAYAAFGTDVNDSIRKLAQTAPYSAALQDRRFTSPWAFRLPITDQAHDLVKALIRRQGANSEVLQSAEATNQCATELIRLFFLLHETAATTLAWSLHLLAQHPEAEADVREELGRVIGSETPSAAHLDQLEQTEMVLRETMRLYPASWLICRQARRETRLGSFFLPAGSLVLCSPYIMQRSTRNFVEPEKFLPARFNAGYEKRMRRFAYAPFGTAAVREETALLTEMKLVLATLLTRFHFVQDERRAAAIDPLVSLRPQGGLPMQLQMPAPVEGALSRVG